MSDIIIEPSMEIEDLLVIADNWTSDCSSLSAEVDQDSNTGRAKMALSGVVAAANGDSHDVESVMKDLLGNLHHLADKVGIDMSEMQERAYSTYLNEIE